MGENKMKILCITPDLKMDYLAVSVIEGLKKDPAITIYCTSTGNGSVNIVSDEQAIELFSEVDHIFIIWGKRPGKYHLLEHLKNWSKTLFIDGSELTITGYGPFSLEGMLDYNYLIKCPYYFKRECYPEYFSRGIIPLPFAAVDKDFGNYNPVKKDIDVLCSFGQNKGLPDRSITSWREKAIGVCEGLKKEGFKIINTRVDKYFEHISRSWITIDAFGSGEINARTFQIPANNSLGFYKRFNVIIPNFVEDVHYVAWDSEEELKEKIIYYLQNKDKIQEMTYVSHQNVKQYHTSEARVKFIFDQLK